MNGIITTIQNLVEVIKSWALNVGKVFFGTDPDEEVTIKMLDEVTNQPVNKPVKTMAKVRQEFEEWKTSVVAEVNNWKAPIEPVFSQWLLHHRLLELRDPYSISSYFTLNSTTGVTNIRLYSINNGASITNEMSTANISSQNVDSVQMLGYRNLFVIPKTNLGENFKVPRHSQIKGKIFFNGGHVTEFELYNNYSQARARSTVAYNAAHMGGDDVVTTYIMVADAPDAGFVEIFIKPLSVGYEGFVGEVIGGING